MLDWDHIDIPKPSVATIIGLAAIPIAILFRKDNAPQRDFVFQLIPTNKVIHNMSLYI
jgi:hypothetical protein